MRTANVHQKSPPARWRAFEDRDRSGRSAEADLGQDALAGQQLGTEADDEAEHGETAIPGLSEVDETKTCVVGHGVKPVECAQCNKPWSFVASRDGYEKRDLFP